MAFACFNISYALTTFFPTRNSIKALAKYFKYLKGSLTFHNYNNYNGHASLILAVEMHA